MPHLEPKEVVPTADSTANIFLNEVVGNKEDAASKTASQASIIALLRQLLGESIFQHQADATLSQANPVSATLYTILDTTLNVRIISIETDITWATTQPTPLEIVVTIDGVSTIFTVTDPVSATAYFASLKADATANAQTLETTDRAASGRPFLLEGRSVKVEARITWATTQPTPLDVRVKYAKIP